MVAMPNTSPAIDSGGIVRSVLEIAKNDSKIPFLQLAVLLAQEGKEMAAISGMKDAGVVMIGLMVLQLKISASKKNVEYAREFDFPRFTL